MGFKDIANSESLERFRAITSTPNETLRSEQHRVVLHMNPQILIRKSQAHIQLRA